MTDPIHGGHLSHIREAKKLGTHLTVIAGTEEQCRRKHQGKIFLSWEEKEELLKALGADDVVPNIDTDGSCAETLRTIRPDIYAKGAEYTEHNIPQVELDACREMGCQIAFNIGKRINHSRRYFNE